MNDSLATSTSDFAVRLLKHFHSASVNTIVSPLGVLRPLASFMYNSDENTRSELTATLLGSAKPSDSLVETFSEQFTKTGQRLERDWHHIKTAKFLYAHKSWPLSTEFVGLIKSQWQITGKTLDLHTKKAPRQINTDVAEQTRDKFDNVGSLLPPNSRLVAVSALDIKLLWSSPFPVNETVRGTFRVVYKDNQFMDCTVPIMSQLGTLPYYEDSDGTKAVQLKGTDHLSLVVILPKEGQNMSTFLHSFTGSKMQTILGGLQPREMVLFKIPHFKVTKMEQMAESLKSLGIKQLFSPEAHLKSSMFSAEGNEHRAKEPVFLSDILQGCQIVVSEEGTTANMSKPVVHEDEDSPAADLQEKAKPSHQLVASRAFLFVLIDKTSRQFLYFGVVEDPTQELKDLEYAD